MPSEVLAKIEQFFGQHRLRKYDKGQVLILNGDPVENIYYLASGKVKEYDVTNHGDEMILNVFKPPAFFPISLAINKSQSPYIFAAETDIEVRQAPADEVVNFIKDNPDVMFDLLTRVYRGVDGLIGRIVNLMSGSANNRLIYELVIEARRFGKTNDNKEYMLQINEKDLGARAGLSRETISREINKLKTNNLIAISSKGILITDLRKLEKKLSS